MVLIRARGVKLAGAGFAVQVGPATAFGQRMFFRSDGFGVFMHHLDEKQQYQFGDVVRVVDAVVSKNVAEVPEFLDGVVVGRGFSSVLSPLKEQRHER